MCRSGQNIQGLFHTENTTDTDAIVDDDTASPIIDYKLYHTLWSLQSYFSNPPMLRHGAGGTATTVLEQANAMSALMKSLDTVLTAFEGIKLSKQVDAQAGDITTPTFPKYLTSVHLLTLQLHDSQFRRHILIQCLILFHYLLNPTGTHDTGAVSMGKTAPITPASIPQSQLSTIRTAQTRVFAALRLTPPHGT